MPEKKDLAALIRENKTLFIIITVGLFLIELEIFALAATKSGRKSWIQVSDDRGTVIYETDGSRLSDFNKYYFEKTFGPFENYQSKLITREVPFPFRAWFVAAVGVPIGAVLLFGFVFRAYMALFQGERPVRRGSDTGTMESEGRLEQVIDRIGRLNIFAIGFLVLVIVLSYWIIPNAITYIGKTGVELLIRYKWIFIAVGGVFLGIVLWIIYLRYLLAKKAIESQVEVDKYRLQLEYQPAEAPKQIGFFENEPGGAANITQPKTTDRKLADRNP